MCVLSNMSRPALRLAMCNRKLSNKNSKKLKFTTTFHGLRTRKSAFNRWVNGSLAAVLWCSWESHLSGAGIVHWTDNNHLMIGELKFHSHLGIQMSLWSTKIYDLFRNPEDTQMNSRIQNLKTFIWYSSWSWPTILDHLHRFWLLLWTFIRK